MKGNQLFGSGNSRLGKANNIVKNTLNRSPVRRCGIDGGDFAIAWNQVASCSLIISGYRKPYYT